MKNISANNSNSNTIAEQLKQPNNNSSNKNNKIKTLQQ